MSLAAQNGIFMLILNSDVRLVNSQQKPNPVNYLNLFTITIGTRFAIDKIKEDKNSSFLSPRCSPPASGHFLFAN